MCGRPGSGARPRRARRRRAGRERARVRGADGPELRRGRGGADRRRPAHGLHRAGARRRPRRPGAAAGSTGRHRGDRADRAPRRGLLRLPRPGRTEPQGSERSRARVRAARSGPDPKPFRQFPGARLLALRRPRVVLMTGEPGAGKSRLCHELVERAHGVALHHARALSHGRMLPFHVLVALARSLFGVAEGGSPSDVRDAVTRGLEDTQPDPIALDFWLDLFGVSDHAPAPSGLDPDERRARLFRSLFDLIRARARRELTMLWVEDLHWLDSASEAALEMLVERLLAQESAGSKLLLLATTRPEYRPGWSARLEGLSLAPLAWEDSRMLLDDWLGPDGRLAPLRARIDARARGNPLFVEEMIRSLVERGVLHGERGDYLAATPSEEIALPETVQAVLASRIDRLADRDKDVLQAAAVVGQDVPIELLRAVVDLPSPELAASLD